MSCLYITDNGHPRIIVRPMPWSREFNKALRDALPNGAVEWQRGAGRYFVNRECRGRVEAIAGRHFDTVTIQEGA